MRFSRVDIFELVTDNDHALVAQLHDVRVRYDNNNGKARDDAGVVVAHIQAFDDDSVDVLDDAVKIEGILMTHATTTNRYGYWLCRA